MCLRGRLSTGEPASRAAYNAAHVGSHMQRREDVPHTPQKVRANFPAVIVFDEAQ
jgi:hypothetical protein